MLFRSPLQLDQRNRQERELAAKLATAEQLQAQREEATLQRIVGGRPQHADVHEGRATVASDVAVPSASMRCNTSSLSDGPPIKASAASDSAMVRMAGNLPATV